MNYHKLVLFCCIFLWAVVSTTAQSTQEKIQVLIVDGFSNHDWAQTSTVVKPILQKSDLFHISVSTSQSDIGSNAWRNWNPEFGNYDVVIQNTNNIQDTTLKWPEHVEKNLMKYLKSGGGLYILHSANNAYPHWQEYDTVIGLGWRPKEFGFALQVAEDGEIKKIPPGEGRGTYHGPRNDEKIHVLKEHPINKGMPKIWKTPDMELYKYARGPAKNLTVLSYAIESETNIKWPVEWVVKYGKGRVYNSSMGHLWKGDIYPVGYRCVGFQTTLIRAAEWLGTGKVTYPIPKDFPSELQISLVKGDLKQHVVDSE